MTLRCQKNYFFVIFPFNLPAGTLSSVFNLPNPGFWWPKNKNKNYSWKFFFFCNLTYPYPSIKYRYVQVQKSLQPSKENIQHFKTWNFLIFFLFLWVIFALGSGSETLRWFNFLFCADNTWNNFRSTTWARGNSRSPPVSSALSARLPSTRVNIA